MRRILSPFAILLAALWICSSCLKSDDDDVVVSYDDTAITTFVLGTVNQYLHTTSSTGEDSIYKKTVTGSNYKFYIDQLNHEIYNPDSLPMGCDVAHVLCTISSKNSGNIYIKNIDSDTLKFYSNTDSIDFSVPRTLCIESYSNNYTRDYIVRVNVHKQETETCAWQQTCTNMQVANMFTSMQLLAADGRLHLFGSDGNSTQYLMSTDGANWQWSNAVLGPATAQNVVAMGNELYMLDGGQLTRIAPGGSFSPITTDTQLQRLLAASSDRLFALDDKGAMVVSTDKGATWEAETLDNDASLLPVQDVSCAVRTLRTNTDVESILLVGNRSADDYPSDATAVVWNKTVDPVMPSPWFCIDQTSSSYPLHRMKSLKVASYGNLLLALGGAGFGGSTVGAYSQFYVSRDGGINWKSDDRFALPVGLRSNNVVAMTADDNGNLWVVSSNGLVWRGRLENLE